MNIPIRNATKEEIGSLKKNIKYFLCIAVIMLIYIWSVTGYYTILGSRLVEEQLPKVALEGRLSQNDENNIKKSLTDSLCFQNKVNATSMESKRQERVLLFNNTELVLTLSYKPALLPFKTINIQKSIVSKYKS